MDAKKLSKQYHNLLVFSKDLEKSSFLGETFLMGSSLIEEYLKFLFSLNLINRKLTKKDLDEQSKFILNLNLNTLIRITFIQGLINLKTYNSLMKFKNIRNKWIHQNNTKSKLDTTVFDLFEIIFDEIQVTIESIFLENKIKIRPYKMNKW
jgi:hypothetical protein